MVVAIFKLYLSLLDEEFRIRIYRKMYLFLKKFSSFENCFWLKYHNQKFKTDLMASLLTPMPPKCFKLSL